MSGSDSSRARRLARRAGELAPDDRPRFLDAECAQDPAMRSEVERLLARCDDDGAITETGPAQTPGLGRIGSYRILEKIGQGAMGVVYLAERDEPRQRVAVKVIRPGMDTEGVLARFDSERQALALMNHPNVAHFHDAGTAPEGRPYFVMEYVAGVPVTEHCDRHRLNVRQRLELFEQICRGVHHAHQKGVIHRDIKPSNVLVQYADGVATPKIIDFGVAKALHRPLTAKTFFTAQGHLVGTPEYMSPEQAKLTAQDVDIRSDVYSLGVLLYELLTGALPFDRETLRRSGLEGVLRLIRETDPPRPSTRLQTLESSDPRRSSENAHRRRVDPRTLARSLRDDLDWITMTCLEKDRARRYESASALAEDIRRHLENEVVRARPPSLGYRAQKLWKKHRAALSAAALAAIVFVVSVVVVTGLTVSNIRQRHALDERRAGDLVERARLLGFRYPEDAERELERAIRLDPRSDEARLERARLYRRQGRADEAVREAREILDRNPRSGGAAALLAGLLRDSDPEESRRYTAIAEGLLEQDELQVALAYGAKNDAEAIALLTRGLEANPWNFEALSQRAVRRFGAGELDGARADAELMVKVRDRLPMTWIVKGAVLLQQKETDEARQCFDRALALGPESWIAHFNRGLAYARTGEPEQALADFDRALELRPGESDVLKERGRSLEDLGRFDEAVTAYRDVIRAGVDDWGSRWDLAVALWGARDYAGARREFGAALGKLPDGEDYAGERCDLRLCCAKAALAMRDFASARDELERIAAGDSPDVSTEVQWGRWYRLQGRYDEARDHFDRAVSLDAQDVTFRLERGVLLWRAGDADGAIRDLARFAGSDEPDAGWVRLWIWEIEALRGRRASADEQLALARSANATPLLARVTEFLSGTLGARELLEGAATDGDRLQVDYAIGARALVESDETTATQAFRRLMGLGIRSSLEHELAEWRLEELQD